MATTSARPRITLRALLIFAILLAIKYTTRLFWRIDIGWVGRSEGSSWKQTDVSQLRIVAILNHTSLFDLLLAASCPNSFLLRIASAGVLPAADKTLDRPLVGILFRFVAAQVVSISRQRDHTWRDVLGRIGPHSMVMILPEGRMKRPNGLDLQGQPMTVRGGIADLLEAVPEGLMLLAYSGGLHHVQAPGEVLPRFFRRIKLNFEVLDIPTYRNNRLAERGEAGFKRAVVEDLQRRRDLHCPPDEPLPAAVRRRFGLDQPGTE